MKLLEISKLIIGEKKIDYIVIGSFCAIASISYYFAFQDNYEQGLKLIIDIISLGFNIFVFFPSLSFVILGVFPSLTDSFKIKLMTYSEEGTLKSNGNRLTKIESYLGQYIFIMYWSLLSLFISLVFLFLAKIDLESNSFFIVGTSKVLNIAPSAFIFLYSFILTATFYELFRSVRLTYNIIVHDAGKSAAEALKK